MKPVAILGSGPAGMLAAYGASLLGKPIAIFSKPVKSQLSGAQFLHEPVPGMSSREPDAVITYRLRGDANGYRAKVYGEARGPMLPGSTSFESIRDGLEQPAWNLIKIYDELWNNLRDNINDVDIDADWIDKMAPDFDHIISSIPLPAICRTKSGSEPVNYAHHFSSQSIWLRDEAIMPSMDDNTVYYSGDLSQSWYRTSKLFGHPGTEWSQQGVQPPYPALKTGIKPVTNTCDCHPNVTRVGRFGEWKKGVLTHHALRETLRALA